MFVLHVLITTPWKTFGSIFSDGGSSSSNSISDSISHSSSNSISISISHGSSNTNVTFVIVYNRDHKCNNNNDHHNQDCHHHHHHHHHHLTSYRYHLSI